MPRPRARDVHVSTTDVHADATMSVDDDDALFEAAAFDDDQGDAEPEPTRCLFSEQMSPGSKSVEVTLTHFLSRKTIRGT